MILDHLRRRRPRETATPEKPASYVVIEGAMMGHIEVGNVDLVVVHHSMHDAFPVMKNCGRIIMGNNSYGRSAVVDDNGLDVVQ